MKLNSSQPRSAIRVGDHPTQLMDHDLSERSESISDQCFEARLLSGQPVVREFFHEAIHQLGRLRAVAIPIAKQSVIWTLSQFTELSRISARPAARARMASANRIRTQPMIVRVILVPLASLFIALGVAAQISSGLGVGPGDMVASGISTRTGLSFGTAAVIMSGTLATVATLLGRPPRLATLVNVVLIALSIDVFIPLLEMEGGVLARLLHFSFGLWAVGIGLGCLLHARLGMGTHEALSLSISDRTGVPAQKVRLGQEILWILIGLTLGSQFGPGTVLVAIFIGPAIGGGTRSVGRFLTTVSKAIEAPEVAAHVDSVGF